jgi:hypothetical protein
MKKKVTLLLLAAGSMFKMNSQVLLSEDFTSPFNPATNGWSYQNLTGLPGGTPGQTWFQGNASVFSAYNGSPNDYLACNWASSTNSTTPETINNWLITPTLNLVNGGILQFATRTSSNPASFPDRLEVYYSIGTGTNVGNTATSVGTFSTLIVSINPSLTTTGYPGVWTVYTNPLTGLSGPTVGRIGFRYFVTNGGPAQTAVNSDFIGLDGVRYSLPCGVTIPSYTICSGGSATLSAMGGSSSNSYTWSPGGSNSSSIVVTPGSTSAYTLTYNEGNGNCPVTTGTVTIGSQLSFSITASSTTICSGSPVTFTANSTAMTYSWNTGATTPVITVTPNATSVYTVAGYTGVFPSVTCAGANTIQITVNPTPTLGVSLTPSVLCDSHGSITVNASGASTYAYLNSTSNPQSIATPTAGNWSFLLIGTSANGCSSAGTVTFVVNPNPTVTVSSSTAHACTNSTVIITGAGANTYAWSGASTSTANPLNFVTGATAGTQQFTLTGTDQVGCTATVAFTQSVVVCNTNTNTVGLTTISGYEETSIFPNPFSNELKINVLDGSIIVYNALGQVVISTPVHSSETINTAELPKGAYLLKAFNTAGETVKTVKLLKN